MNPCIQALCSPPSHQNQYENERKTGHQNPSKMIFGTALQPVQFMARFRSIFGRCSPDELLADFGGCELPPLVNYLARGPTLCTSNATYQLNQTPHTDHPPLKNKLGHNPGIVTVTAGSKVKLQGTDCNCFF
jgi:hypothetical protein